MSTYSPSYALHQAEFSLHSAPFSTFCSSLSPPHASSHPTPFVQPSIGPSSTYFFYVFAVLALASLLLEIQESKHKATQNSRMV